MEYNPITSEKVILKSIFEFIAVTKDTANELFPDEQSVEMKIAQRHINDWYGAMFADIKRCMEVLKS